MSQPILMPFQDLSFNGDTFVNEEFLSLKEKYNIKYAIETGSCFYSTTEWLGENFDFVYTCEINYDFAKFGEHKILNKTNVTSVIGDSVEFIKFLRLPKEGRALFFLDAHWGDVCPLLDELTAISEKQTDTPPVIVIHDFYTGNEELGYDSYHAQPFTFEWIEPYINKIAENFGCEYTYYFNEKAIGAKRGVIYIVPKIKKNDK